jgi:hypothetical protein
MLDLDSIEWKNFLGGYKVPYDASIPLRKLESSDQPDTGILDELCNEFHHQGDTGVASYAAVPHLSRIYREKGWVDFNLPTLLATIEGSRLKGLGPELPEWVKADYFTALRETALYCLGFAGGLEDKCFSRATLTLAAVVMRDDGAYSLLDQIDIGYEERAIEVYYEHG